MACTPRLVDLNLEVDLHVRESHAVQALFGLGVQRYGYDRICIWLLNMNVPVAGMIGLCENAQTLNLTCLE